MKNPTQRDRDTIIDMLQAFRAAQETLLCGVTGSAGNPKLMPKTWTPEMRELERCLSQLCRAKPKHHRHVMARYVDPVLSRRTMVGRVKNQGHKQVIVWPQLGPHAAVLTSAKLPEHKGTSTYTCLVASWPAWVNKPTIEHGIDCLLRWYEPPNAAVGPTLPDEMLVAA
jgi:hypothetical protein